jgi:hypothetical protein
MAIKRQTIKSVVEKEEVSKPVEKTTVEKTPEVVEAVSATPKPKKKTTPKKEVKTTTKVTLSEDKPKKTAKLKKEKEPAPAVTKPAVEVKKVTLEDVVASGKTRVLVDDILDIVRYELSQNARFADLNLTKVQVSDIVRTVFDTTNGLISNGIAFNMGSRVFKRTFNKGRIYSGKHGEMDKILGSDDTLLLPGVSISTRRELVNKVTLKGTAEGNIFTDKDGTQYNLDTLNKEAEDKFKA